MGFDIGSFVDTVVESIEAWLKEQLAESITGMVKTMNSILYASYGNASSMSGKYLRGSPLDYSINGMNLWATVKKICDNAIVPVAGGIMTIILLMDLVNMLMKANNFKDIDDSIILRWVLKCYCGHLLITNIFVIARGLFQFGATASAEAMNAIFSSGVGNLKSMTTATLDTFKEALLTLDITDLLVILLPTAISLLIIFGFSIVIVIVLAQRILEAAMYVGAAPIPVATFLNESWSSVGKSWVKACVALGFQSFFIIICLGLFKNMYEGTLLTVLAVDSTGIASSTVRREIIMSFVSLAGFSGAMIFTMLRSSQISKSIFNA